MKKLKKFKETLAIDTEVLMTINNNICELRRHGLAQIEKNMVYYVNIYR